jgi:ankyrin repeat protein
MYAAHDAKIVNLLINAGADVNLGNKNSVPLTDAVLAANFDSMLLLLKAGARINFPHIGNPLYAAVDNNMDNAVQLLLSEGADPTIIIPIEFKGGQTIPMSILDFAKKYKNPSHNLNILIKHHDQLEELKKAVLSLDSTIVSVQPTPSF